MDDVISVALYIEELRNLICEYCNIEDIVKLYIILELNLPVKYTKNFFGCFNTYINLYSKYLVKYKSIKKQLSSVKDDIATCEVCSENLCIISKRLICGICSNRCCEECYKECPSYDLYDSYHGTEACQGYICKDCIKNNYQNHMCEICNKFCCCTINKRCGVHKYSIKK